MGIETLNHLVGCAAAIANRLPAGHPLLGQAIELWRSLERELTEAERKEGS